MPKTELAILHHTRMGRRSIVWHKTDDVRHVHSQCAAVVTKLFLMRSEPTQLRCPLLVLLSQPVRQLDVCSTSVVTVCFSKRELHARVVGAIRNTEHTISKEFMYVTVCHRLCLFPYHHLCVSSSLTLSLRLFIFIAASISASLELSISSFLTNVTIKDQPNTYKTKQPHIYRNHGFTSR